MNPTITKVLIFSCFVFIILFEEFISIYAPSTTTFIDVGFYIFYPINQYIKSADKYILRFCLFSLQTSVISMIIGFAVYRIIMKNRFNFAKQLLTMYSLRVVSMVLFILPNSPDVVWHFPGIPLTLNDYFYSGHVGLSIICGNELHRAGYPKLFYFVAIIFNIYQTFIFWITQSHYTCDVITAIFAGTMCTLLFPEDDSKSKKE